MDSSTPNSRAEGTDPFDFSDIPDPISDAATLEEMLGEAEQIRVRGRAFLFLPPTMKVLRWILRTVNGLQGQTGSDETPLDVLTCAARKLLWVHAGDTLRPATIEEIEDTFTPRRMLDMIQELLTKQGLELDEKGGSSASQTGAASSAS